MKKERKPTEKGFRLNFEKYLDMNLYNLFLLLLLLLLLPLHDIYLFISGFFLFPCISLIFAVLFWNDKTEYLRYEKEIRGRRNVWAGCDLLHVRP